MELPGYIRSSDHLHHSTSTREELRYTHRSKGYHRLLLGGACQYHFWDCERCLETWKVEKLWYFIVYLRPSFGTEHGPRIRESGCAVYDLAMVSRYDSKTHHARSLTLLQDLPHSDHLLQRFNTHSLLPSP